MIYQLQKQLFQMDNALSSPAQGLFLLSSQMMTEEQEKNGLENR